MQLRHDALYRFDELKSEAEAPKRPLRKLTVAVAVDSDLAAARKAVRDGIATANGVELARTLGNRPGNRCTPTDLATQAQQLKQQHTSLKVQVLERKDMEKLGMGALLSVSRGSRQPAKLIVLEYKGSKPGAK